MQVQYDYDGGMPRVSQRGFDLRLVMSALLKAVKDFNSQGQDRIIQIGILPDDLELKMLRPEVAFKSVREVDETA